ncbi:MAG: hypothetical protein NT159_19360 [Proteobacteria bacterium]|nr:hypothetical protein [Pseudomonadota bacterium]
MAETIEGSQGKLKELQDKLKKLETDHVALRKKVGILRLIGGSTGRLLAVVVGGLAIWFACAHVSKILSTNIKQDIFLGACAPSSLADSQPSSANSTPRLNIAVPKSNSITRLEIVVNPAAADASPSPASKAPETNSTAYTEAAWAYVIKVLGSTAILLSLLWVMVALWRSDPRD